MRSKSKLISVGLSGIVVLAGISFPAHATDKSRLAFVGDIDTLYVGQDGYCGSRTFIEQDARMAVFVTGNQKTWLRIGAKLVSEIGRASCTGEYSFIPKSANAYVIRYTWAGTQCLFELLRVVPGADPVREAVEAEEPQVCLGK